MEVSEILLSVDLEIARLKQVRTILSDGTSTEGAKGNAGNTRARKKRTLSPETRKRIAEAQRKRWAAQKSVKNK
jgi:hypothetical protein